MIDWWAEKWEQQDEGLYVYDGMPLWVYSNRLWTLLDDSPQYDESHEEAIRKLFDIVSFGDFWAKIATIRNVGYLIVDGKIPEDLCLLFWSDIHEIILQINRKEMLTNGFDDEMMNGVLISINSMLRSVHVKNAKQKVLKLSGRGKFRTILKRDIRPQTGKELWLSVMAQIDKAHNTGKSDAEKAKSRKSTKK